MPFNEQTIQQAWNRSGGRCECTRILHSHSGRCNKQLSYENRGREGRGAWEAHHRTSVAAGGSDSL